MLGSTRRYNGVIGASDEKHGLLKDRPVLGKLCSRVRTACKFVQEGIACAMEGLMGYPHLSRPFHLRFGPELYTNLVMAHNRRSR